MKKTILSTVMVGLLCLTTSGYAYNIKQGTLEVAGGINLKYNSSEENPDEHAADEESSTISFGLDASYFVRPNYGFGAVWKYSSSDKEVGNNDTELSSYGIGPSIFYYMSINREAGLKLTGSMLKTGGESGKTDISGFMWGLEGELKYFFNKNISLNITANYAFGEMEYDDRLIQGRGTVDYDSDVSDFTTAISLSYYFSPNFKF